VGCKRAGDNVGGLLQHLIGVEAGRVDNHGVGGRGERGDPTHAVARVAFLHVLQDIAVYSRGAAPPQLLHPPRRARLRTCGNEQLHRSVGADGGADVAAVEHDAAGGWRRMGGEVALQLQ